MSFLALQNCYGRYEQRDAAFLFSLFFSFLLILKYLIYQGFLTLDLRTSGKLVSTKQAATLNNSSSVNIMRKKLNALVYIRRRV